MDIVGKRGWLFLISGVILVPGIIFLIIAPGLRPGIDFTGGSTVTIEFVDPVAQDDLRDKLAELDLLQPVCKKLGKLATLHLVDTADHGFRVLKRGRTSEEPVLAELARVVSEWMAEIG